MQRIETQRLHPEIPKLIQKSDTGWCGYALAGIEDSHTHDFELVLNRHDSTIRTRQLFRVHSKNTGHE